MPKILCVGTALPPYRITQAQAKKTYASLAQDRKILRRHLSIFDHAGVSARYACRPLSFYRKNHPFKERNEIFIHHALRLGRKAIGRCFAQSRCRGEDIHHFFSTSTTGLATPSLEARLAPMLELPSSIKRTPLFGTGCASGVVCLARAMEYLEARPKENALILSVELCSLNFQNQDHSIQNLVASAIFGDGAGAALVCGDQSSLLKNHPKGPRLIAGASHLYPNSLEMMGWNFSEDGMTVILAAEVPKLVSTTFRPLTEKFLKDHGLRCEDISLWLLHPGGLKVIEAYEKALGITPEDTRYARRLLARYGNLSSASIFFILSDAMRHARPKPGSYGLLVAMGPGFAAEFLLLQW
ncbi:MAG: 3-oxoacyl-[acyl-carrier-protein] synthase III C-terminal domain-containing protein [Elusimicrobiota bacterium]